MSDHYTQVTVQPDVPADLVTEAEKELLEFLSMSREESMSPELENIYFFSENYSPGGVEVPSKLASAVFDSIKVTDPEENIEMDESHLIQIFQNIIKRSEGKVPCFSIEGAFSCSKMRPGEFGGFALFITADSCNSINTGQWVWQQAEKYTKTV